MRLQTKFEDYILLYIYIILYYITYNNIDYLLLHWKSPNTKVKSTCICSLMTSMRKEYRHGLTRLSALKPITSHIHRLDKSLISSETLTGERSASNLMGLWSNSFCQRLFPSFLLIRTVPQFFATWNFPAWQLGLLVSK